jgi:uncharacterized protein (TIGR02444 family)
MSAPTAADFQDWAEERYARAGVADILLELQDMLGLNVNVLLWCGWCAENFAETPELPLKRASDLIEGFSRDVTAALRAARRALKNAPRQADGEAALALRSDIRALEFKAERIEQQMLAALAIESLAHFPDPNGALPKARRVFARYAALAGAVRKPGFSTLTLDELASRMFPYSDGRERLQA